MTDNEYTFEPVDPEFIEKLREVSDEDAETKARALRAGLEEYDL